MTMTRKLFALSAISALSFALTACGDDSGDKKENNTPATPQTQDECSVDTFKASCSGDTYKTCVDGKITSTDCTASGQVCGANGCEAKQGGGDVTPEKKCTDAENTCKDGTTLSKCNATTGKMEDVNCAQNNQICDNNQCIKKEEAKCTANDKKCTGEDSYAVCDADGKYGEDQKCPDNQICQGQGECKDKPAEPVVTDSLIGKACTCSGNDCQFTITGAELKAALGDELRTGNMATMVGALLPADDAKITAPNYFSKGIKGCEDLKAPAGMAVGCMTSDKITFDADYVTKLKLIVAAIPAILQMAGDPENPISLPADAVTNISNYVEKVLTDGIPFTAKNGYCILADIDIALDVTSPDITPYIKMAAVNELLDKINTPGHDHSKAKTATCPEGSVLLSYDVDESTEGMGSAKVGFDMCLKSCKTDDDCRKADGYSCVALPNGVPAEGQTTADLPTVNVCFDKSNIDDFTKMTEDFANLIPAGEGE